MLRAQFKVSTLRSLSRRQSYVLVLDFASSPPLLDWYKMRRGEEVKRSFTFQSCIKLEKNNKDPTCLIVAFASPGNAVPVASQRPAASASASAAAASETAGSAAAPAAVSSSGSSVWQKVVFFSSADERELFCDLVHAAIVSGESAVRLYQQLDQQKGSRGGDGGAAAKAVAPPSPASASLPPALQSLVGVDFCSFLIAYSAAQTQLDSSAIARANNRSTQGAAASSGSSGSASQQQRDASTTVASLTSSHRHHSQPSDSRLIADRLLQAHALDAEAAKAGGAGGGAGSGSGEQRGGGGGVEEMFGFQLLEGEVVVMQCPHATRLDAAAGGGAGGDVRSWEPSAVALPPPSPAAAASSSSRPASPSAASSSASCRGNLFITNYRLMFREYRAAAGDRQQRPAHSASLSSSAPLSSSSFSSSSSSSSAAFAAASFPFLFPSASFSSPTADFELTLGAVLRLFTSPSSPCCLVVVSKDNRRLELGFDNGSDWVQSLVSQLQAMAFRPVSKLFAFEHGKAVRARRKERREARERRAEERRRREEAEAADAEDESARDERDGWTTLEPQAQPEEAAEEEGEVDGWSLYSPAAEYARLGLLSGGLYRLSTANANFSLCPTYPPCFVTPAIISDADLASIASHRSQQRLPAVVYLHPLTGATLSRSAQPLVGVRGKRNELDEALISVLRRSSPCNSTAFVIMDARPYKAAMGNAVMGKGYESTAHYERSSIVFCGIDNIHHVRHSLDKLNAICSSAPTQGGAAQPLAASAGGAVGGGGAVAGVSAAVGGQVGGVEDSQWLLRLDATQWLHYIRLLLSAAVRIAICLSVDGCSVLARCSDGWDRTAQLTSLTLLMLDPFHRTMRGFAVLVEKEWLSFGHHFAQRHGQGSADWEDGQRAPVFLQWLDCVWQLMRQFPAAFEFNEEMLVDLWDAMIGNCYGSFLFDSQREREEAAVSAETESVWTALLSPRRREKYVNPLYQHRVAQPSAAQRRVDIIDLLASSASAAAASSASPPALPLSYCIPNVSARRLVLWERFHLRWDREYVRTFLSSSPLTGRRQQQDREQRRILRKYHTMRSMLQQAGVDVDALDTEDDAVQLGTTEAAAAEKGRAGSANGGDGSSVPVSAKDRKVAAARTLSARDFARAGKAAQPDDGGSSGGATARVRPALHLNTFSPPTPTASAADSDSGPSFSLSISAAVAKEELGTEEQKQ